MAKWYILHTVSGAEKMVKKMIEDQIVKKKMSESFKEIVIPTMNVPEIKRGKKVIAEKKLMPSYILIKMNLTDESWHLVKSVPKITGFLGSKTTPHALSDIEVESVFKTLEDETRIIHSTKMYNVGDKIQVIDGPFDSFAGIVEEIDLENQKLKISISIFGKSTPIELGFTQVKKN